ncbi:hypothetical protein [Paraflavitalea pollutisoli]|uniref:hypothetical protein n=1 Tax=Paraflavitalea pollutisoli TaxID=3034143 RepID=UPI0023EC33D0|nr:hypothetical protein [Paraflavitalea sp. H1-2-19X]
MYTMLLVLHSAFRWLVVFSLLLSLYRSYRGYWGNRPFTRTEDRIRHWTATIAHVQLMIGMVLYFQSPLIKAFLQDVGSSRESFALLFFGMIHSTLMLAAIVLVTIGSALAKRKPTDRLKFKTMLVWYTVAAIVILIAIPWPFSPFAARPYFR